MDFNEASGKCVGTYVISQLSKTKETGHACMSRADRGNNSPLPGHQLCIVRSSHHAGVYMFGCAMFIYFVSTPRGQGRQDEGMLWSPDHSSLRVAETAQQFLGYKKSIVMQYMVIARQRSL